MLQTNVYNLIQKGVMLSIIAIMFGSVSHLAYTFSTIEGVRNSFVGWVLALGVEVATIFTGFGLKEQARFKDKASGKYLRRFLVMFCLINLWGNYYYGIDKMDLIGSVLDGVITLQQLQHLNGIVFSAALPLMAMALIEVYAVVSKRVEIEEKKNPTQKRETKEPKQKKATVKAKKIASVVEKEFPAQAVAAEAPDMEPAQDQMAYFEGEKPEPLPEFQPASPIPTARRKKKRFSQQ